MPGAASFLLRHRGSRRQAGRPHTLAHFLTASQSLWLALTPTPTHTLVPTHTHTRPPLVPSLAWRARAPARDLAHTRRARRWLRPSRAAPDQGAACRAPARAPAPPSRRGCAADRGRWPAVRGTRPGTRTPPSGSSTCGGIRPPGPQAPPRPSPPASRVAERRWSASWEGTGSARELHGRALPTRPQTVLTEEGKRVGGEICSLLETARLMSSAVHPPRPHIPFSGRVHPHFEP